MDNQIIYFKKFNNLIAKLTQTFSDLRPEELRNLLFSLQEFNKNNNIPEDTSIYSTTFQAESLEIISKEKISKVLVGGIKKYINMKKPIPPVIIIKGNYRFLIVSGESYAIESYLRKKPVKAIVFDINDRDIFETFKFDENWVIFLVPIIKQHLEK